MKKWYLYFLSLVVWTSSTVQAQTPNRLATAVQNELISHAAANYQLFTKSTAHNIRIDNEIRNVVYLKMDKAALQALKNANDRLISFSLPLNEGEHAFTLNSYNIFDEGFKVYQRGADGKKRESPLTPASCYRGILNGQTNSLAAFTFLQDEVVAVFSTIKDGNYNLVLNYVNPGVNRDNYLLFKESDIINQQRIQCGVTDAMKKIHRDQETTGAKGTYNSCHKLRVSMQADYELFQIRQSSVSNTTDYLTGLFNVIAALYNNEGINAVMSEVVVNSVPDGYTYGSSEEVLFHFSEATQTDFNGDIAHLVSGYNENGFPPLGGLAFLDVLCMTPEEFPDGLGGSIWIGPYGISDNYIFDSIPQLPIYSWDVEAATHEMGHNIGSPHTQSCTWAGGPIDNCYGVEDGSCNPGPDPDTSGGTIMSYCHLTPAGINFAFGFGPLPGALIRENMAERPCLSSFQPLKTLAAASTVRIANRQCSDGLWVYFYYDNNTAAETDDELLLMIKANGQDIGDIDATGVQVSMTTAQAYATNIGRTVTAPYAASNWKEANRTWKVTLPSVLQPASSVSIRFPFTQQDVLDIKGSIPSLTQANELSIVTFNNQVDADNPMSAPVAGVNYYTNANTADVTHWKLGMENNYNYAEFVSNFGIFGGSIGFNGPPVLGIDEWKGQHQALSVYPNPATNQLNITIPASAKSSVHEVTVYDYLGRMILKKDNAVALTKGILQVNIASLSSGMYTIRYTNDGASFNGRFVKK